MKFKTSLRNTNFLIDLTPLVDVTFLMLIFFLVTSDILPLKSLNVENPRINQNSAALTTQLLLVMDAQNVIYLGPKKEIVDMVSLERCLRDEIGRLRHHNPEIDPSLVLSIDRRVDYGAFLRVFAIAQRCGPRIRLVYKPDDESEVGLL